MAKINLLEQTIIIMNYDFLAENSKITKDEKISPAIERDIVTRKYIKDFFG